MNSCCGRSTHTQIRQYLPFFAHRTSNIKGSVEETLENTYTHAFIPIQVLSYSCEQSSRLHTSEKGKLECKHIDRQIDIGIGIGINVKIA